MANLLTLSELQTLHNTKFFEIKIAATKKIEHLFAGVRDEIKDAIEKEKFVFPKEVDASTGKIFRGENYLGLPYLVLDYPKHFSTESVFAFRTMFWWGNFFSFTLHLQGKALEECRNGLMHPITTFPKGKRRGHGILPLRERWKGYDIYICMNNNPWQYHYKKDNYLPIEKISDAELKKLFLTNKFIKLSRKTSIKDYKKLSTFCKESFLLFSVIFPDLKKNISL